MCSSELRISCLRSHSCTIVHQHALLASISNAVLSVRTFTAEQRYEPSSELTCDCLSYFSQL